jgi:VWFA-related protein
MFVEGGQSAVIDAIYLSAEKILQREKTEPSKRYALILISDGEERDSYHTREELFDLLNESEAQFFGIGLTRYLSDATSELTGKSQKTTAKNLIKSLAVKTGGAAFFIEKKNKDDFEAALIVALRAILTELNSQYVVGYDSTNQNRGDSARKLTVQIAEGANGAKRQAVIRESFVVPKEKNK